MGFFCLFRYFGDRFAKPDFKMFFNNIKYKINFIKIKIKLDFNIIIVYNISKRR